MALIKDNRMIEDRWQEVDAETPLPKSPVLVTLADWQERKDDLTAHAYPCGVILPNDSDPAVIGNQLQALDLIVLEFPAFTDGRAYSQARQLREQYGFNGEIRARGDVLRDQVNFMLRCGIDAFEIDNQTSLTAWQGEVSRFTNWYQPAADHHVSIFDLRHQAIAAE